MNGYGERCGNANLVSIMPALQLKMGLRVVSDAQLERLTEAANFVADIANVALGAHAPYVGRSAFAHKGGLHVAAVEQAAQTFEHVDPASVGNEQRVLISELSGKGAVLRKAQELGLQLSGDDERVAAVLRRLKDREHRGYHYEAADASFDLLLRDEMAPHEPLFRLESFRVLVEKREDGRAVCEATIKIHVGDERLISTAEGNGPVNALDSALRQAIVSKYPHLADIELVNYKVRILDEAKGTGAVTRVLLDASDGEESWGSIGVSENIVEASWEALVDSIEYGMLRGGAATRDRDAPPAGDAEPLPTCGEDAGRPACRPPAPSAARSSTARRGTGVPPAPSCELLDRPAYAGGARVTGETGLDGLRLLAPSVPGKVVAVGLNYRAHAAELSMETAAEPILFLKPSTAVIGPGDPHRLPGPLDARRLRGRAGARRRPALQGRRAGRRGRRRRRLHLRQRRHRARPAEARRAVDAGEELRHVLPAGPLGRARGAVAGGARERAARRRRGPARPRRRHDRRRRSSCSPSSAAS